MPGTGPAARALHGPVRAHAPATTESREGAKIAPPQGVEGWIGRYGAELRVHLTRMLSSEADVEDLLQEVWVAAIRRPPDTGPGSNVRAWLYRVATNAAQRDGQGLRQSAHGLKGAATNIGAVAVADSANRLEQAGKQQSFEAVGGLVQSLSLALVQTLVELHEAAPEAAQTS